MVDAVPHEEPAGLPDLDSLVPDLLGQLTRPERRMVLKYWRRMQRKPENYGWKTKVSSPTHLNYAQLAFTFGWYDAVRKFVALPLVVGIVLVNVGRLLHHSLVLWPGIALIALAIGIYIHLYRRSQRDNTYFRVALVDQSADRA